MTTTKLETIATHLEAKGLTTNLWTRGPEPRLYVKDGGRDLGWLGTHDDGTTGTCRGLTRRAGFIAGLVREALA